MAEGKREGRSETRPYFGRGARRGRVTRAPRSCERGYGRLRVLASAATGGGERGYGAGAEPGVPLLSSHAWYSARGMNFNDAELMQ